MELRFMLRNVRFNPVYEIYFVFIENLWSGDDRSCFPKPAFPGFLGMRAAPNDRSIA